MVKTFEYMYTTTALDSLTIDDIGNTCIKCFNDLGLCWYIETRTEYGLTEIRQIGPFIVGSNILSPKGFQFLYNKIDYSEDKIIKLISAFLNDGKKIITQALEVEPDEMAEQFRSVDIMMPNGIKK